jgi:hypothetical protein
MHKKFYFLKFDLEITVGVKMQMQMYKKKINNICTEKKRKTSNLG